MDDHEQIAFWEASWVTLTHRHESKQKHNINEHVQATSAAICAPPFCRRPRGSVPTAATASSFFRHSPRSMILTVAYHSQAFAYDHATIAQRCEMIHVGMSLWRMDHLTQKQQQWTCPGLALYSIPFATNTPLFLLGFQTTMCGCTIPINLQLRGCTPLICFR